MMHKTIEQTSMKSVAFGLFGAGGFAREVMPLLLQEIEAFKARFMEVKVDIYYVDVEVSSSEINNTPLISEENFFNLDVERRYFSVAVGEYQLRKRIAEKCLRNQAEPFSIYANSMTFGQQYRVGEGAIFCDHCSITSNVEIGKYFHANIYSYIAHDCVIGDFVTFAPRVNCNGNVRIEDNAYIGTAAVLKQGSEDNPLIIGEGAIIGMGAVVTKNVEPYTIVVGNPAKPLQK